MKTFKEYLTEAQKTYMVRIKVAGELPEGFESKLKSYMEKFQTVSFKKVASTPIQEHPHEFQRLKNKTHSINTSVYYLIRISWLIKENSPPSNTLKNT